MEIFIVDESQYLEWKSASISFECTDDGEAVEYISPSSFYDSMPEKIYKVTVTSLDVIDDVIARVAGEYPRYYKQQDIENYDVDNSQYVLEELVQSTAIRLSHKVPSISLRFPVPGHESLKIDIDSS